MSAWRGEIVGGAFVRRAGIEQGAALWLVPALGDSGDSYVPLLATRLRLVFEHNAPDLPGVAFDGGHWTMMERPQETAREITAFFEPLVAAGRGAE